LLVDDHPLIRKGIIALIEDEPDMEVVAEAANGREAIEQFRIRRARALQIHERDNWPMDAKLFDRLAPVCGSATTSMSGSPR